MANQYAPWSDMELNQLKELAGQFSAVHISAQIGRSVEGVRKQIRKLGLKGFVSTPPKPRPIASREPSAVPGWAKTATSTPVAPVKPVALRKPLVVRESRVSNNVSYPPLEWCPSCHSPVSNWVDHQNRLGCKRPAA